MTHTIKVTDWELTLIEQAVNRYEPQVTTARFNEDRMALLLKLSKVIVPLSKAQRR